MFSIIWWSKHRAQYQEMELLCFHPTFETCLLSGFHCPHQYKTHLFSHLTEVYMSSTVTKIVKCYLSNLPISPVTYML